MSKLELNTSPGCILSQSFIICVYFFPSSLFGDEESQTDLGVSQNSSLQQPQPQQQQQPQQSWSKFKETNPDNYRTPMRDDQRNAMDQQGIFGQGANDNPIRGRNQRGQQQRGGRNNNRRGGGQDGGGLGMPQMQQQQQQQGRFPVSDLQFWFWLCRW